MEESYMRQIKIVLFITCYLLLFVNCRTLIPNDEYNNKYDFRNFERIPGETLSDEMVEIINVSYDNIIKNYYIRDSNVVAILHGEIDINVFNNEFENFYNLDIGGLFSYIYKNSERF
jgi:hypothetical protein